MTTCRTASGTAPRHPSRSRHGAQPEQFLDEHVVIAWGAPSTATPPPTYADTGVGRWQRDMFTDLFDAAERWERLRETPDGGTA